MTFFSHSPKISGFVCYKFEVCLEISISNHFSQRNFVIRGEMTLPSQMMSQLLAHILHHWLSIWLSYMISNDDWWFE